MCVQSLTGYFQITQGMIFSKYLTEYAKRYYGVLVAFDEAVQNSDIVLAEALWRFGLRLFLWFHLFQA